MKERLEMTEYKRTNGGTLKPGDNLDNVDNLFRPFSNTRSAKYHNYIGDRMRDELGTANITSDLENPREN